jgi:hypothetical protein
VRGDNAGAVSRTSPAGEQTASRPRDVAVDDEAPVSKMKGLTFQCRSPRTHAQCTRTLGTKHRQNSNLQMYSSKFVAFSRHFCDFCFPPVPDLMPAADAGCSMMDADAGARCSVPPTPQPHQTTYIPNSTHDQLHYVQHCSSKSGLLLTTFGVFDLLRRQQHHGLRR